MQSDTSWRTVRDVIQALDMGISELARAVERVERQMSLYWIPLITFVAGLTLGLVRGYRRRHR